MQTLVHQVLLVVVTQTPLPVFINYAGVTERYKLLLHSHVADFIYITRWQHLRCSLFIFPFDCFHREIIHRTCLCVTYICLLFNREIWFIDVFTLLYCLKNTPTPSLWSHLIWGCCLENDNIYYSPVPGLSIFQFLITYSMQDFIK